MPYKRMYGRKRMIRKRRAIRKSAKVPAKFRKYVLKTIHKNTENKEKAIYGSNTSVTTGDSTTCTMPIINPVSAGSNEQTRVGNQIRVTKGQFRACINLLPYNATTNPNPLPVLVKLWLIRDLRTNQQLSSLGVTTYNNFFRAGNTAYSFNGNPLDMVSECNKDLVRVLATRYFKLGATGSITATPIYGQSFLDNSPMSKQIVFNWGKYVKKQLKFDESGDYATNSNLYVVIQAVNADGSSTNGKTPIEWHYTNIMHYEDA